MVEKLDYLETLNAAIMRSSSSVRKFQGVRYALNSQVLFRQSRNSYVTLAEMVGKGAAQAPGRPEYAAEIDRLVSSSVLHGSEALCRLLRYLAEQALERPAAQLKEYQIAREAFGRPADFDPQSDATVRVHVGRLRAKLEEYDRSEGASDAVIVELPKGGYALTFHFHTPAPPEERPVSLPVEPPVSISTARTRRAWVIAVACLSLALAASLTWNLALAVRKSQASASVSEAAPASLRGFWTPFLAATEDPWVVYSNAAFVGRPLTGMRYFDPERDSRDVILDHYTGIGEVLAVHSLDRVFGLLRRSILVKRGRLLSLDDAKNNNIVFLGSPAENLTLQDIPSTSEFVFQRLTAGPRKGELAIMNRHPASGEPDYFLGSTPSSLLTEDYAVVALLPGLNPARFALVLAGETTLGTQAAAEFVCQPNTLEELLWRLTGSKTGVPGPFEALLRVAVRRGVPIETDLIAIRKQAAVK